MMAKIGRNNPCPCGSGRKYKQCCIDKTVVPIGFAENKTESLPEEAISGVQLSPDLLQMFPGLQQQLDGQELESIDDLQAIFGASVQQRNQAMVDDFHGLSPGQMHSALYTPLEPQDWCSLFADLPADLSGARFLQVFLWLAEEMGEKGLKATAKGNLPRNACRELYQRTLSQYPDESPTIRPRTISTEQDFSLLHSVRLTAGFAGLLRKYKGKFVLTKKSSKMLEQADHAALYQALFVAYVSEFNWGYISRFDRGELIQKSWLFSLYLLSQHGAERRPVGEYSAWVEQAFPMLRDELSGVHQGALDLLLLSYSFQFIHRFAGDFGLLEKTQDDEERGKPFNPFAIDYVQKTALLGGVFQLRK